jgi:hypothetical protein
MNYGKRYYKKKTMARKKIEGSTKKPTVVADFIKLEDLPQVLKQKFDAYRLSEHSIDFAMRVAGGENPMNVVAELYSLGEDKVQIKRQTKKLLSNPKIQQMITTIRDNLKHSTYIDATLILRRLDMLYSEAIFDDDKFMALNVLKEMGRIVKDNSGTVTVTDVKITFELPNKINFKNKDIDDAQVIEQ